MTLLPEEALHNVNEEIRLYFCML